MLTITIVDSDYYPESPKQIKVNDLADIAQVVHEYRMSILFQLNLEGEKEMGRFAEQHFLVGLALLEQAERTFRIAHMEQRINR